LLLVVFIEIMSFLVKVRRFNDLVPAEVWSLDWRGKGAEGRLFPGACVCMDGVVRKDGAVYVLLSPMTGRWVRVHDEMLSHSAF